MLAKILQNCYHRHDFVAAMEATMCVGQIFDKTSILEVTMESAILLATFAVICILLTRLVLAQIGDGDSGNARKIMPSATGVLVALLFVCTFLLALSHRSPAAEELDAGDAAEKTTEWWSDAKKSR